MKKTLLSLALLSVLSPAVAQQVRPATSGQIYNEIAQLKNLTNVLYFAAHPDDENTRFLAWMANDQHIRTAYMSLTRGDGGQNILGTEQGAALGLIRTHELIEARKLDGAGQYFSRAIDFGFSKTYDETFKHWNADMLTSDAVWVIRKFRTDVIICRFPPNEQAGHGQHAASAIIAAKAFKAAGDKNQFAEQLKYYKVWTPKSIVWNTFRFGDRNTTSEDQLKMSVGQYSPAIGMGFGELAGISRSIHRSQGAGTPSVAGVQTEYFKYVDGDTLHTSLFEGIDITWNRVDRPEIGKDIESILKDYDFRHPEASIVSLLELRKEIETVKNSYWRTQKLEELDAIILHCAGIMAELTTKQAEATRGATLPFTLRMIARCDNSVRIKSIKWPEGDTAVNIRLGADTLYTIDHSITIPASAQITEPYWLSQRYTGDHFTIPSDEVRGYPEAPNTLTATVQVKIKDTYFDIKVPLSYKKLDPTHGDMIEQLRIVPAASIDFTSGNLLMMQPDGSIKAEVHIRPFKNIQHATVKVFGNMLAASVEDINLQKGTDTTIILTIPADKTKNISADFTLFAELTAGADYVNKKQNVIQYEHIPTLQYFTPTGIKVLKPNWKSTAKRIGYISGAGDLTANILSLAGLQVDVLKTEDINVEKLKKYDAILVGVRAVNTEKRMDQWMHTLLDYTKAGGTLVMQYNTLQDMSTTNIGPYPLTLTSQRTTEEDAKVDFLLPTHKLLNTPNKITDEDFAGWVQERGLYYPVKYDDKYEALFSMHDTNEKPLAGATLYAPYGKGHYIYTSLSFFRQLPAGNKGAIRLMMNMLSAGK